MEYCIYRFLDINLNIIYVGKAKNLKQRLSGHRHLSIECYENVAFIEYTQVKDINSIDFIECYYIQRFKPKYNGSFNKNKMIYAIRELDTAKWSYLDNGTNYIKLEIIKKYKEQENYIYHVSQEKINKASEEFCLL